MENNNHKCIFVGYDTSEMGYRLYEPLSRKIILSKVVVFDEEAVGIKVKTMRELLVFHSLMWRNEQQVNKLKVLQKLMLVKFQLLSLHRVRRFKMQVVLTHRGRLSYHKAMTSLPKGGGT